jgi:hypothetical protein
MAGTRRQRIMAFALGVSLVGGVVAATAGTAGAASARPAASKKLLGLFTIEAGRPKGQTATGSYFRMVLPTGGFFGNSNSSVDGGTYTMLQPGTAGGLETGRYQPQPSPAFGSTGGSRATAIIAPTAFENVKFSASTARVDPQTGAKVPAPMIEVSGRKLTGNLSAFAASWNRQNFNQGSPKPNGNYPGRTTKVTGTYDPTTHEYTLSWRSQIVGGPFNGFAGLWHLTGTFQPAG